MIRTLRNSLLTAAIAGLALPMPLTAQSPIGQILTFVIPSGKFGSNNFTNLVVNSLAAAKQFCGALDKSYQVDCLAERIGAMAGQIPADGDYAEVRSILAKTSNDMASLARANRAIASGAFADEVVPVTLSTRAGDVVVDHDEAPGKGRPDKIPQLKPAFAKDGTITAATSSSISDGAAALVLTRASVAAHKGLTPVARIVATAAHAQAPALFTTAPIPAIQKVLDRAGWSVADVDLFEVNEAFACVAMFAMRDLGIPHDKINVNGGGTALGHPIGASGTRIIVTLIAALKAHGKTKGVASLCIGGGEATAVAVELI